MSNFIPAWYHNDQLIPPEDSSMQLEKVQIDQIYQNYIHEVFASNTSTFISDSNSEPPSETQLDLLESNLDCLLEMIDYSNSEVNNTRLSSYNHKYLFAQDFINKYS